MAKSEVVSTAKTSADLGKAFQSASKAVSTLGIKMTLKAPNEKVLMPLMAKGEKAEFKLLTEKNILKLNVCVGKDYNTLGLLDTTAEKDAEKRKHLEKVLKDAGLI